jgi:predicted aspartyl protease
MRHHRFVRRTLVIGLIALVGGSLGACPDLRQTAEATVPADSAAGELRFQLSGPGGAAIVVPVSINGHAPVDLILDTGATLTCIDTAFARQLALPERRMAIGMAVGIGAAGRVRLHAVDSLRVGNAVARKLTVCAMDLRALRPLGRDVHGLLGLNVLRNFRVTLDFKRQVLRLAPAAG